ncbi:hypothetical protein AURDEDRAFT_169055 [Auricularia subglabra TFB-10046 SS5]|nr:hypothetical protein AURDEDRAFT_169055 [Auricularia subglabra TFB-10046 SS5]
MHGNVIHKHTLATRTPSPPPPPPASNNAPVNIRAPKPSIDWMPIIEAFELEATAGQQGLPCSTRRAPSCEPPKHGAVDCAWVVQGDQALLVAHDSARCTWYTVATWSLDAVARAYEDYAAAATRTYAAASVPSAPRQASSTYQWPAHIEPYVRDAEAAIEEMLEDHKARKFCEGAYWLSPEYMNRARIPRVGAIWQVEAEATPGIPAEFAATTLPPAAQGRERGQAAAFSGNNAHVNRRSWPVCDSNNEMSPGQARPTAKRSVGRDDSEARRPDRHRQLRSKR